MTGDAPPPRAPVPPAPESTSLRRFRIWAAIPLGLEVFWGGVTYFTFPGFGRSSPRFMLAMLMPALVATLIAVLLFLSTRRWRLFAPGVYLGHALFSVLIYTVRVVVMYSNYALQSGPLWFAYCMVLILGYGWGGWIVWRLGRSEWSALESGASAGNTELNPWTAPAESAAVTPAPKPHHQLLRYRFWALAAPAYFLVIQHGLRLISEPVFYNSGFLVPLLLQTLIALGLAASLLAPRALWRTLAAGASAYFAGTLGLQLFGDAVRLEPLSFYRATGLFAVSETVQVPIQILFYIVVAAMVVLSLFAAVRLVDVDLRGIQPGRQETVATSADDDLAENASWDMGPRP